MHRFARIGVRSRRVRKRIDGDIFGWIIVLWVEMSELEEIEFKEVGFIG